MASKISVCIPTYNQGLYVEKTIRSALDQTLIPDEIIVFNDYSTDDTKEILTNLEREIVILKVFHQEKNVGITKNVNDCFKKAQGDFIVRIDSDDLLLPSYIECLSALLVKYPDAGYAHCAIKEIDQQGNYRKDRRLFRKSEFQSGEASLIASLKGYRVAANILMFRREALLAVDYIKSPYNFAEDFYLSVDIASKNIGNVYCDKTLACYRVWTDVVNLRNKRKLEELRGMKAVYNEILLAAFVERNWDITKIEKAKAQLAQRHADCLNWSIYSKCEKEELEKALLELSSSHRVKLTINAYKIGFGGLFKQLGNFKRKFKTLIKNIILVLKYK